MFSNNSVILLNIISITLTCLRLHMQPRTCGTDPWLSTQLKNLIGRIFFLFADTPIMHRRHGMI